MEIIEHPLIPFTPENARLLVLGSFPPPRERWSMDFFYPNFINDFWRICGIVFFGDKDHFVARASDEVHNSNPQAPKPTLLKRFDRERIIAFCRENGIAMFDTASAVRRLKGNASDKFLEVVEPTNIPALLTHLPHLRAIVTTGEKATDTICASLSIPTMPKVNTFVPIPNVYNQDGQQLILYRLPSSSRAYPLAFDKKVEAYRRMFLTVSIN